MKKYLSLAICFLAGVALTSCTGCALSKSPVPATRVSGSYAGVPFTLESPKQAEWLGVDVTLTTGTTNFHLHIDSVKALNDPQVIDKASAGRVAEIKAWSDFADKKVEAAMAGAAKGMKGGL